ncbi:MAG: hypothetical protein ACRD4Q_02470 [Candidatus Acidiferrales bacterium]
MPEPPRGLLSERIESLRSRIENADIIVAQHGGEMTLFYGRDWLQAVLETGMPAGLVTLSVPIDWETDDPEVLTAACQVLKGQCDYPAPDRTQ